MRTGKKNTIYIISIASLAMSIIAVCVACFRTENLGFDYQGVIVGVLSLLVTALLGWQIYSTIALEERMRKVADDIVTKKSEDIKKMVYNSLSTTYISLIATALNADRYFDAILYNECLMDCAINSKDKATAKWILENASLIKADEAKLNEYSKKMFKSHVESITKKLLPVFPDLADSLIHFLQSSFSKSP